MRRYEVTMRCARTTHAARTQSHGCSTRTRLRRGWCPASRASAAAPAAPLARAAPVEVRERLGLRRAGRARLELVQARLGVEAHARELPLHGDHARLRRALLRLRHLCHVLERLREGESEWAHLACGRQRVQGAHPHFIDNADVRGTD